MDEFLALNPAKPQICHLLQFKLIPALSHDDHHRALPDKKHSSSRN